MITNKSLYLEEEGHTLIIVIIMIAILLSLVFTANELCSDNYKVKNVNSVCKKNFYVAEALSEEADIKLHEYLKKTVNSSYELVLKYVIQNDEEHDMDIETINRKFKSIFKQQIKMLKDKIENENDYNLKIVDKYNISVDITLEQCLSTHNFNISIFSVFKDEMITEKIRTKYIIKLPEYSDFEHNRNLIDKIDWVNYK